MSNAHKLEVPMKHNQQNSHETRIALLEQTCSNINQTLIRLEKKMDDGFSSLDTKIDKVYANLDNKIDHVQITLDKKIDSVYSGLDKKIDGIHSRIWTLFMWGIGAFAAVLALIAHAEKWI